MRIEGGRSCGHAAKGPGVAGHRCSSGAGSGIMRLSRSRKAASKSGVKTDRRVISEDSSRGCDCEADDDNEDADGSDESDESTSQRNHKGENNFAQMIENIC